MTSVDPSHLPIPGTHRTWGQAGYAFNDDEDHPQPTIHLPKIPDLRFEQGYLLSIRPFVKDVTAEEQTGHEKTQEFVKEGVVPGSSTYGVPIRIDWQGVAWVTFRDQVMSPLLQGAVWGTAAVFVIPFLQQTRSRVTGYLWPSRAAPATAPQVTPPSGEAEVGPWRRWVRSLLGGVETNVALSQ